MDQMKLVGVILKFNMACAKYLKVYLEPSFYISLELEFYILGLLTILVSSLEGLLQQLLSLKWTEPALVEVLGHYLDAMGPFLKYFPDAAGSVINKLFELLNSLPFVVKVHFNIFTFTLIFIVF